MKGRLIKGTRGKEKMKGEGRRERLQEITRKVRKVLKNINKF